MLVRMMTVWLYFDQFERELVVKNEKGSRPESSLLDAMDYPGLSRRPSMMTRRCSEGRDLRFFLHIRSLLFPLPKSYRLIKHEPTMFFNSQISNRSIFSAQKPLSHRLLKNCLSLIDCNFIDRYRQGQRYRYQSKV